MGTVGRAAGLTVVLVAILAAAASAQHGLRVTYDVQTGGPKVRVSGRVVNEGRSDVFEVYVTAEALDAAGRVVARGITYVDSKIAVGQSQTFSATVPAVPSAQRYRAAVSSYRTGLGAESP